MQDGSRGQAGLEAVTEADCANGLSEIHQGIDAGHGAQGSEGNLKVVDALGMEIKDVGAGGLHRVDNVLHEVEVGSAQAAHGAVAGDGVEGRGRGRERLVEEDKLGLEADEELGGILALKVGDNVAEEGPGTLGQGRLGVPEMDVAHDASMLGRKAAECQGGPVWAQLPGLGCDWKRLGGGRDGNNHAVLGEGEVVDVTGGQPPGHANGDELGMGNTREVNPLQTNVAHGGVVGEEIIQNVSIGGRLHFVAFWLNFARIGRLIPRRRVEVCVVGGQAFAWSALSCLSCLVFFFLISLIYKYIRDIRSTHT